MSTTRRSFIKQSAGAVAVGLVAPRLLLREARAQTATRKVLVIIQLAGGNDGLNTVIPYADSRYASLRPTLSFRESELKDSQGRPTIISHELGLHPAMVAMKEMYDAGRVAIVNGVGYPNPTLSHFLSMDIYHTANPASGRGLGWLGKYADLALLGKSGLKAASVGGLPVKSFSAAKAVLPNILSFDAYDFLTDPLHPGDQLNQVRTLSSTYNDEFPEGSFIRSIADSGVEAVASASRIKRSVAEYRSTVVYPSDNPLAAGLKMLAQMIVTIPELELLYAQMGGFDTHANQIASLSSGSPTDNKLMGDHARLLRYFSEGVKAFYEDLVEHGIGDDVLMMQWSEFGRRPSENASLGTDHGTAVPMFIIGNPVRSGIYGRYPSLDATGLDSAGNLLHTVDFREVYATILDRWLGVDSTSILGGRFADLGFVIN